MPASCIQEAAAPSNVTQSNLLCVSKHCSLSRLNSIIRGLFFTFSISRDVFFVGGMLLSSVYIVILLSRLQRQCHHFPSINLSSRVSPERRATQTILLLASFFLWSCTRWASLSPSPPLSYGHMTQSFWISRSLCPMSMPLSVRWC